MIYLRNEVAKIAKINVGTLRFYEQNGLLTSPTRDKNGYRLYDDDTVKKLQNIKYAKSCGFTLEEIKKILAVFENKAINYNSIIKFIDEKINDINQKVDSLNNMKVILDKIKINIDDQSDECPIKSTFKNL